MCLVAQACLTLFDPLDIARQAPLSMGFSRQEYWSGLSFPSPGDLPDLGIKPTSPALAGYWAIICTIFKQHQPRVRTTGCVSSYHYYHLQYLNDPSQASSTYYEPRTCFGAHALIHLDPPSCSLSLLLLISVVWMHGLRSREVQ